MADQGVSQPPPTITAPFPAPPPFWKHFTQENLSRLEAIVDSKKGTSDDPKTSKSKSKSEKTPTILTPATLRALEVPQDLSYLIPPPPPQGDSYTVFSDTVNLTPTLPPLSTQNIAQLIPDPTTNASVPGASNDPSVALLRLSKSLVLSFLELTTQLSVNPTAAALEEKLEDIRVMFLNAHHVINTYRPHQARETLVRMLQDRVNSTRAECESMEAWGVEVSRWLEGVEGKGNDVDTEGATSFLGGECGGKQVQEKGEDVEEKKRLWKLIGEIDRGADVGVTE